MTSLGRLIFFDQPGTGASDPVTPGALPTLEQWADSITAVFDDLGSREAVLLAVDGAFATAALFAATHPSRTTALVVLEGYADPLADTHRWIRREDSIAAIDRHVGHGGVPTCDQSGHAVERGDPGDLGSTWNAWRRARATVALMLPLVIRIGRAGGASDNPRAHPRRPSRRRPDRSRPRWGKYVADHIPGAKYVELPGRNCTTSSNRGESPSRRSPIPHRPPGRGGR